MSNDAIRPISIADAAQILGVSRRTVYHWIDTGVMPAPGKLGGRSYWLPVNFNAWLERRLAPLDAVPSIPALRPARRPAGRPRAVPAQSRGAG